jgi:hypothetical protein
MQNDVVFTSYQWNPSRTLRLCCPPCSSAAPSSDRLHPRVSSACAPDTKVSCGRPRLCRRARVQGTSTGRTRGRSSRPSPRERRAAVGSSRFSCTSGITIGHATISRPSEIPSLRAHTAEVLRGEREPRKSDRIDARDRLLYGEDLTVDWADRASTEAAQRGLTADIGQEKIAGGVDFGRPRSTCR